MGCVPVNQTTLKVLSEVLIIMQPLKAYWSLRVSHSESVSDFLLISSHLCGGSGRLFVIDENKWMGRRSMADRKRELASHILALSRAGPQFYHMGAPNTNNSEANTAANLSFVYFIHANSGF